MSARRNLGPGPVGFDLEIRWQTTFWEKIVDAARPDYVPTREITPKHKQVDAPFVSAGCASQKAVVNPMDVQHSCSKAKASEVACIIFGPIRGPATVNRPDSHAPSLAQGHRSKGL